MAGPLPGPSSARVCGDGFAVRLPARADPGPAGAINGRRALRLGRRDKMRRWAPAGLPARHSRRLVINGDAAVRGARARARGTAGPRTRMRGPARGLGRGTAVRPPPAGRQPRPRPGVSENPGSGPVARTLPPAPCERAYRLRTAAGRPQGSSVSRCFGGGLEGFPEEVTGARSSWGRARPPSPFPGSPQPPRRAPPAPPLLKGAWASLARPGPAGRECVTERARGKRAVRESLLSWAFN